MRSRNNKPSDSCRSRRRGSALIVTVGALAFVAVFAAIYITMGQADARVADTVDHKDELASIEDQVAEYIARVIAEDRLSVMLDTITGDYDEIGFGYDSDGIQINPDEADRQRFVREATDYPYTDYSYKSVFSDGVQPGESNIDFDPARYGNMPDVLGTTDELLSAAIERFRFNPAGDHGVMLDYPRNPGQPGTGLFPNGDVNALRDYRTASDPWLSSSEPTFLGRPESLLLIDQRLFSADAQSRADVPMFQEEFHYLDNRDWAQISNLAPDGLSVNLFNLRGHFEAEPGLGRDREGWPRLSENRTLLTLNNPSTIASPPGIDLRSANNVIRATDRLHIDPYGLASPALPSFLLETDPTAFAIRNTPAWWTMNQRFLYFPADPAFQILGRPVDGNGVPINIVFDEPQTWATPDYPDYQYADADGDGFYDSRWFSLTDSTLGFLGTKDLLEHETDMRFFIAARVVDLSGRVNVNAATDSLVPPTSEVPPGATPAEIDLRRLLTMQDAASMYRPVFANTESIPPDLDAQHLSLAHIEPLPFSQRQAQNPQGLVASDYSSYLTVKALNLPFLGRKGIETGRYAYDALRREIQGDQYGLPSNVTNERAPNIDMNLRDATPFEYFNFDPSVQSVSNSPTLAQLAAMPRWRRDYWHDVGGVNIADPTDPPLTSLGLGGHVFDLEDLAELLTFNGVNDDSRLSRLERVTQGRYESDPSASAETSTLRFGPLRANRPTSLERTGHDNQWNDRSAFSNPSLVGDNQIDYESMALAALDVRRRLTTISGAAPLRSRIIEDADGDGILSNEERRLTADDARLDLVFDAGDPAKLFALYADALAPYAEADGTWNMDPEGEFTSQAAYRRMRTLAYGHRGSELALRISSHLAVNMADMYDEDDEPSAYTVVALADPTGSGILRFIEDTWPTGMRENHPMPWWVVGNRLDLDDEKLAPLDTDVNGDFSRIAYNVYGLEPQPFITEVAVLTVYTDTPRQPISAMTDNGFDGLTLVEDEDPGVEPGNDERPRIVSALPPSTAGDDEGAIDDITIRMDISPENPDLVAHILAIQLTNPFDVPIELSGEDARDMNDGGALNSIPNQLEDVKFYIEFNGHFFPLAGYFERSPDINPATGLPYPDVVGAPRVGDRLYAVTLEPGESRVFYVSAHPWVEGMNQRWKAIEKVYADSKDIPNGIFYDVLPDMTNRVPFEEFIATQFTVTKENGEPMYRDSQYDARAPVRLIPFNPRNGQLARAGTAWGTNVNDGTFVDFLRTSLAFRNPGTDESHDRMRQEVRLWRKMSIEDSSPFNSPAGAEDSDYVSGNSHPNGVSTAINWIENDLLVDRMRDPVVTQSYMPVGSHPTQATLDHATFDPSQISSRVEGDLYASWSEFLTPSGPVLNAWQAADNRSILNTTATAYPGPGSNTSQGLTFTRFAGYRRPDHLSRDSANNLEPVLDEAGKLALRGLLPAWCIESTDTNHNIVTPIDDGVDRDLDNDGTPDVDPLALLEDLTDFYTDSSRFNGVIFGFAGDAGTGGGFPVDGDDDPPYFSKMLRGFMRETVPSTELNSNNTSYTVPDMALIPTMRRHPALKSDRGDQTNDLFDFSTTMSDIGIPGTPVMNKAITPHLLNSGDAGLTGPSVMDERQSLLTNNSDRFGFDGQDPRTAGIRLGDLLLPLGVGATFAPGISHGTNEGEPWNWSSPENFRPGDWTTVAEALSAALGLEPPAFYNKDPGDAGYSLMCELVEKKGTIQPTAYDPPFGTPPSPTNQLAVGTPKNEVEFILDKGRIDIGAYTPFYNQSLFYPGGGSEELSARFIAGAIGVGDRRVGLSVPPAQRLLSMAQAITRGGDPLTTPVIGTINVNTAPDAVLRTIPGFSTSLQMTDSWVDYDYYEGPWVESVVSPATGTFQMEWAPARVAGKTLSANLDYADFSQQSPVRPLPFGIGDPFSIVEPWKHRADIAPALTAFRDRSASSFSLDSVNPATLANGFSQSGANRPRKVFDFTPSYSVLNVAFGLVVNPGGPLTDVRSLLVQNYALDMSRSAINGQFGASERPGFDGVGDLLGISIYKRDPLSPVGGPSIVNPRFLSGIGANGWGQAVRDQANQGTLTRYAWDDLAMAAKDQDLNGNPDPNGDGNEIPNFYYQPDIRSDDDYSYTLGRGLFYNRNPNEEDRKRVLEDELADDILEELAIFNGAANTVDTRSDFFAAWFIIRGYRESDVEGLDDAEPMTPSYEKRFMMVIDRSNVVEVGQMPRILFLREVPL